MHEEFGLSNFLPLRVFCGGMPARPILAIAVQLRLLMEQIPGNLLQLFEGAEETGVAQCCVQVGEHEGQPEQGNLLGVRNEMDNIVLAIGQFGTLPLLMVMSIGERGAK